MTAKFWTFLGSQRRFDGKGSLVQKLRLIGFQSLLGLLLSMPLQADPVTDTSLSFSEVFHDYPLPMLIIEPLSGEIVHANQAASEFYGYPIEVLEQHTIDYLNLLSEEQLKQERLAALSEKRNYFIFRHQLASGTPRLVAVYSKSYWLEKRSLLVSTILPLDQFKQLPIGQAINRLNAALAEQVDRQSSQIIQQKNQLLVGLGLAFALMSLVALVMFWQWRRQKQMQSKLSSLNHDFEVFLENTGDFIYFKDAQRRIQFCSLSMAKLVGEKRWQALIGKTDYEIFPTEMADNYYHEEDRIYQTGEPLLNKINPYYLSNGETGWVQTHKWPVWDATGKKVIGLFGMSRDVTEMHHLQQSLETTKQQAEEANLAKTVFVQNVSHEVRTPMTTILGMSETSSGHQQDAMEYQIKLHHIHRSALMMMTLLDDLSDIAKIETGHFEIEASPFYLSQLLLSIQDLYAVQAEDNGITLQCERLGTLNEATDCFNADAKRIGQVLFNLLENAIDSTQQGQVKVLVWLRQDKNDQAWLKFEVEDTGTGIHQDQQRELYELFSQPQLHPLQQKHLGLSMSQLLVQKLGGEGLQFQSEVDNGSLFWFEVPVTLCSQADEASLIYRPIADVKMSHQASVLLVEDNHLNQKIAEAFLKKMGIDVTLAENGQEAVILCQQQAFDLVLMDIHMPIMDGYEATQVIRGFAPNLPIIALTAAVMATDKAKAKQVGMNDHLCKPIVWEKFQQTVQRWLTDAAFNPSAKVGAKTPLEGVRDGHDKKTVAVEPSKNLPDPISPTHQALELPTKAVYDLLIVDDVKENLRILANGLSDQYQIHVADRGYKALELAKATPQPDLILLDVMMPDVDGFEVCRLLRNDPKTQSIPVIFVTALDDPTDESKGLDLGAVDFISKPFNLPVIRSRVRSHLNLKVKTDMLEQMSHLDGLTHIANRRLLDERLLEEAKRHARNGQILGLVMIDIDFFKAYNDHYGHGKGDECLIAVAQALKAVVHRPSDLLARYGGEEFAVVLPDTNEEGVLQLADRMRRAVSDLKVAHAYSSVADHVTISVGVIASRVEDSQTVQALLKHADLALYRAKKAGRNRVKLSRWQPGDGFDEPSS